MKVTLNPLREQVIITAATCGTVLATAKAEGVSVPLVLAAHGDAARGQFVKQIDARLMTRSNALRPAPRSSAKSISSE